MITIRRAAGPDADTVALITAEAYQHYVPRIGREPAPMTTDYGDAVRDGQAWGAEDDGHAVAIVVLIPPLDHLLAEEQARELGYAEIRLYTHEAMTENIAYSPRRGYAETHRGGQDGYRRVFFRKQLSD